MMEVIIILERGGDGGWGAYSPEVPRLGIVGYPTEDEAREAMRRALELYVEEDLA